MIINLKKNILIVGLGLLGGSYGKGLKKYGFHISAITRSQKSIDYALENGIIDEGTIEVDPEMIGKADIVVFALYPSTFVKWIKENQQYFKPGALITDVTGVKTSVVFKIQDMLRSDVEFIAAHPMAGKEVYGVENSNPDMFVNANYIVTPTEKNSEDAIESCKEIGSLLGFKQIVTLTCQQHDEMIGFLSQLTHVIAVCLMTCNQQEGLQKYTGDSFRDLTRIAKINDLMWSELFVANKDALINQMDLFMNQMYTMRQMIVDEDIDGMRQMMRLSTERRKLFDK